VSLNRYAKKTDATQREIVDGLRRCGVQVWVISKPCDLLTLYRGKWLPLETKATPYVDKRQEEQIKFLKDTGTPVVRTFPAAYEAVTGNKISQI
jgi:hypothetical protein